MSNPRRRRRSRRANPARRRARSSNPIQVRSNPRRRRNPHTYRARRRSNPRRRRNPIGTEKPFQLLTPSLIGALGATAVNTLMANIGPSLPAALTTGNMAYVTNLLAAMGLALLAPHAGSRRQMLLQAAEGSMTVTLHQAIVSLSGGFGATLQGMGRSRRMAMYMPGIAPQAVPTASGNPAQLAGMNAYLTGGGSAAARIQAARQQQMGGMRRGMRF